MKKFLWKILNSLKLGGPIQLAVNSQLKEDGWFNSFYKKESVDKNNNPIPWYSYSFIKFLHPRLKKEFSVFEYGSGNSTLWFSGYVKSVKAVEHDKTWYEKVKTKLPANAEVVYREIENKNYAKEVSASGNKYEIIIIDGVDRNNCVYESTDSLSQNGVIIFDNSAREEYRESIEFLFSKGFKKIEFWGMCPVTPINTCTSVFYKDGNCLGI
ncbi:MAG: FkbM family methyltransferase [Ignavibacteria bacterium GWB2_35_6b]|nr:MAG: FkbM family methyltransferase [Ignavibacteria bacterium GWB2_35_6b]